MVAEKMLALLRPNCDQAIQTCCGADFGSRIKISGNPLPNLHHFSRSICSDWSREVGRGQRQSHRPEGRGPGAFSKASLDLFPQPYDDSVVPWYHSARLGPSLDASSILGTLGSGLGMPLLGLGAFRAVF